MKVLNILQLQYSMIKKAKINKELFMGVFIKRTRGLQTIKQVEAHVKYVGFRSREIGEDKGVF